MVVETPATFNLVANIEIQILIVTILMAQEIEKSDWQRLLHLTELAYNGVWLLF